MTDPLLGALRNQHATLRVVDVLDAPDHDPRIQVMLTQQRMELNLAELSKLIFTLKQAQDLLVARKAQAFLGKNLKLF